MPSRSPQTDSIYSCNSSRSDYSDNSTKSQSTAPTVHGEWPSMQQYKISGNPHDQDSWDEVQDDGLNPGGYASTTSSLEDLGDDLPPFEVPEIPAYQTETQPATALTSSPEEFSEYFPSTQKLSIRHDDTTIDGNMNLRIDIKARTFDGVDVDLQLFHLRMYNLKGREFSLRRYSRASGREVCHSSRKYTKPSVMRRPGLQRSMSNALSSLRSKSESRTPTIMSLKRHDSGYDSLHEDDLGDEVGSQSPRPSGSVPIPTNTTQLEFSNYTHIAVKRRGTKTGRRYELEYWGKKYTWHRTVAKSNNYEQVSYHFVDTKTSAPLAHIVQLPLSESEQRQESSKGGWVPPCVMFLEFSALSRSSDLADIIMASGLIALVDDCIKRRWHHKKRVQMTVPALMKSPLRLNMEHVGPKRLLDEVFNHKERPRRPTPLREMTC